jgi:hypothetical protein
LVAEIVADEPHLLSVEILRCCAQLQRDAAGKMATLTRAETVYGGGKMTVFGVWSASESTLSLGRCFKDNEIVGIGTRRTWQPE